MPERRKTERQRRKTRRRGRRKKGLHMILIWSSFTQIRALLRLRFEAEETHVDFGSVPK